MTASKLSSSAVSRPSTHSPGDVRAQIHDNVKQGKQFTFTLGEYKQLSGLQMHCDPDDYRTEHRLLNDLCELDDRKGMMRNPLCFPALQ